MELNLKRKQDWFDLELVNERGHGINVAASKEIGGNDNAFRPMELVAGALAACSSIDVLNILKKQRIRPERFNVKVQAKRSYGVIPSIFEEIQLIFNVSDDVDKVKVVKAIELSLEKYCSISQILAPTCNINYILKQGA